MPTKSFKGKSCTEHGKRKCHGSGALSELFENPIHPLQIHMVPPFVDENSVTFHLQIHGEDVYRSREISGNPATVFDLLQVSVKPLGYQFEEMVLGTQSRISIRRPWRKIQATADGKRRKKLELRLGLNCPLNQRRSISVSQSFSYAPCFQGASLSI